MEIEAGVIILTPYGAKVNNVMYDYRLQYSRTAHFNVGRNGVVYVNEPRSGASGRRICEYGFGGIRSKYQSKARF